MSGESENPFFVMDATVDILSKELTPTAPPMHSLNLQINFSIADNLTGNVYAQTSIEIKGVGQNETKAYIQAIKNIDAKKGQYKAFVEQGKTKILEFYNSQCDFVISKATALQKQGNNSDASKVLKSVPPVCKECYDKCMTILATIPHEEEQQATQQPVAQATSGMSTNTGTYQVEIDNNIYLVYRNSKILGNKLLLYFEFENRGTNDYELKDYAFDTRIIDQNGAEHRLEEFNAGGNSYSTFTITIMPGVPVKMECQFEKVDKVTMFEYIYKEKVFRIKDITIGGGSDLNTATNANTNQGNTNVAVQSQNNQQSQQVAVTVPNQPKLGDIVLAVFGKEDNFYRKRYIPAKIQTLPSTGSKGETQLIVINDEVPENSWTSDILYKWHAATASELTDGRIVIFTDDETPDLKSVYYPGIIVMTDELYKGLVSIKGRWGDIHQFNVKQIAIVDAPVLAGPSN